MAHRPAGHSTVRIAESSTEQRMYRRNEIQEKSSTWEN
jgi:hypothetical protein